MNYAQATGDRNAYARAATNQGMVERDLVKFEAGLAMLAPTLLQRSPKAIYPTTAILCKNTYELLANAMMTLCKRT
jgi:hypothetical protein